MLPFLAILVVSAAEPIKLATPGLRTQPVDGTQGSIYTEHLSTQLAQRGLRVITQRDIETLLGMERQRQLLGCAENSSSCFAELGNALGAEAILSGDVIKAGKGYQLNLKVIRATDGEALAFTSERVGADDVIDALTRAAESLAEQLQRALRPAQVVPVAPRSPVRWAALGVGAVGIGVGVGGLVVAGNEAARLRSGAAQMTVAGQDLEVVASGRRAETIGWIGLGVGAAAGVAAVLLFALPVSREVASFDPIVAPSDRGLVLGLQGRF